MLQTSRIEAPRVSWAITIGDLRKSGQVDPTHLLSPVLLLSVCAALRCLLQLLQRSKDLVLRGLCGLRQVCRQS
jgi:hypothetical protein